MAKLGKRYRRQMEGPHVVTRHDGYFRHEMQVLSGALAQRGACRSPATPIMSYADKIYGSRVAILHDKAPAAAVAGKIQTLEEASLFFDDLANSLPEHADWLWDVADKLKREVASLRKASRTASAEAEVQASRAKPRRFARWALAVEARVYGKEGGTRALISEVSEGGLKIATGLECRVGEEVVVAWRFVGDDYTFKITGEVRYRVPDGTGIEFLDASPADRQHIRQFCRGDLPKAVAK